MKHWLTTEPNPRMPRHPMLSNSQALIPREDIAGSLNGVDFGPRVSVIARSEKSMLLWLGGHSRSVNGNTGYSASHLVAIIDRRREDGWRNYKSDYANEGGRLTVAKVRAHRRQLVDLFGEEHMAAIEQAVVERKTLLIEGGGDMPQPHFRCGRAAYERWRDGNRGRSVA